MKNNYEKLIDYAIAKGYTITHYIQEIGSGVNDNRQKLTKLLKNVIVEMAVSYNYKNDSITLQIIEESTETLRKLPNRVKKDA